MIRGLPLWKWEVKWFARFEDVSGKWEPFAVISHGAVLCKRRRLWFR